MAFADSYLGRLREKIGSELVLMPGAMVALLNERDEVLVTRRTDNREWCLPAGAAEPGGSFAATAIAEAAEEVGVVLAPGDLEVFGSLSEAEGHTIRYPNGDITHCFALLLMSRRWEGIARPTGSEVVEVRFVPVGSPPKPIMEPARLALSLLPEYMRSGRFQLH